MLIDVAISGDRNVIKERSPEDFKIQRPHNRNTAHVECKSKGDTGSDWSDWDHFKVNKKIREQHSRKP
jgi:PAB1-binding protein PBP1